MTKTISMLLLGHSLAVSGISGKYVPKNAENLNTQPATGTSDSCKSKYIDYILKKGYSYPSYFLNINLIDKEERKFEVVIANGDLFPILTEEQNIDEEKYNQLIKNSVLENNSIKLQKAIREYNNSNSIFLICTRDKEVNKVALKGSDYFIKYFFSGGLETSTRKKKVNYATVIKELIEWNIPVIFAEGIFHPEPSKFICP